MAQKIASEYDAVSLRLHAIPVTLPFLCAVILCRYCPTYGSPILGGTFAFFALLSAFLHRRAVWRELCILCVSGVVGTVWAVLCFRILPFPPDLLSAADGIFASFRAFMDTSLRQNIGGESGILISAMLTGVRDTIPDTMQRAFSQLGISHILAISGLHLSALTGLLAFLLRRIGLRRQAVLLCSCVFALVFCAVCGFPYSLLRAMLMYVIFCTAFFAGTDASPVHSLCHAGCVICLMSPTAVGSLSFQMSFCATLGIVLLARPLTEDIVSRFSSRIMRRFAISFGGLAASTFSANLFLLPIYCLRFGTFAPASFLVNFLFVPFSALLLYSGIFTSLLQFIPVLGKICVFVTRRLTDLFLHLVYSLDVSVGRVLPLNTPYAVCLCIALAGLSLSYCLFRRKADWGLLLIFVFCCILYGICAALSADPVI